MPLQVQAADPYSGTPFSGVTVTFGDGGKGGNFSNPTVTADSSGFASTTYTLPQRALTYNITASSSGLASATFQETALPASPSRFGGVPMNEAHHALVYRHSHW